MRRGKAPERPANLPSIKQARPTGFDKTVKAVPERISRAIEDEAHSTAPKRPVNNVTAKTLVFTIRISSPKPKYGTTDRKTQKNEEIVMRIRYTGCCTTSIKALKAMLKNCLKTKQAGKATH